MTGLAAQALALASPRVLLLLALALGVLSVQAGRGSLAYFTSTQTSTGNQFIAGAVTLDTLGTSISRTSAGGYLKPGDTVTGSLAVTNSGTIAAYYSVAIARVHTPSPATTALENAASLTVQMQGTGGSCSTPPYGHTVVSGVTLTNLLGSTHTYSSGLPHTVPAGYLFGNGTDATADSVSTSGSAGARTLSASGSETLCFTLPVPIGTAPADNIGGDNAFKSADITYTLTAKASQQANR